jgi:hypothetical protein
MRAQRQPIPTPPRAPDPSFNYVSFQGGLNETVPPWQAAPGSLREAQNYEMGLDGGYKDIAGYERFDGQLRPSEQNYAILNVTVTGSFSAGDIISGSITGETAVVIAVGQNGSQAYLAITKDTGAFTAGEDLSVSAVVEGTVDFAQSVNAAYTPLLNAQYKNLAADEYRQDILEVPGEGSILGVAQLGSTVYAFRNNVGQTETKIYKSTASGWELVSLGKEISFSEGDSEISDGDTIIGLSSGASAKVDKVVLQEGSWEGGDASGRLILSSQTGVFSSEPISTVGLELTNQGSLYVLQGYPAEGTYSGEQTDPPSASMVALSGEYVLAGLPDTKLSYGRFAGTARATGNSTDITLLPNGDYEFYVSALAGQTRIYGCDKVNRGFEFDGSIFVPIETGMIDDTPDHVIVHNNHLFFAFDSSIQHSAIGNPYSWSPILGAAELATEDSVTGFSLLVGDTGNSSLMVFGSNNAHILYGNSVLDWNLVEYRDEIGAFENSIQLLEETYFLAQWGVTNLRTTQRFGNFVSSTISDNIRDSIIAKKEQLTASALVREKSQYRLYFNDGSGYSMTIVNGKLVGVIPQLYVHKVLCVSSYDTASGEEIYFGSDDGFVYQMEKGTSFDGENIEATMVFHFNHMGSPRVKKRWMSMALEVSGDGYGQYSFSYELGYGKVSEVPQPTASLIDTEFVSSRWDAITWDAFIWDGITLEPSEMRLSGSAENMSIIIRKNSDFMEPIQYSGAFIRYLPRRQKR